MDTHAEPLPPTPDVPDPRDPQLFPQLTARQRAHVARFAERVALAPGELLFDQGQRDAPFYVLEEGSVDFFYRRPDGDHTICRGIAGSFAGDIAVFTGEPCVVGCVAAEPVVALRLDRPRLRELVAQSPDLGDLLLRTFMARRSWLEGHGYALLQLIGVRWSRDLFRLRQFLARNQVPVRWYDTEADEESRILTEQLHVSPEEMPVLLFRTEVLRHPDIPEVADLLGLRVRPRREPYALVVIGAGPAGLASAVYGASEGLDTYVVEAASPGGQAGTSSKIENYLGFATGISGGELTRQAVLQARKFGATLSNPSTARRIRYDADAPGARIVVELDDGTEVRARMLVLANGAVYRRLEAEGSERLEGAGVYYAATHVEALHCRGDEVVVVGGGNSAGQAAVFLSGTVRRVRLVVRGPSLSATMSQYLIDRIRHTPNIELRLRTQAVALHGDQHLEAVTLRDTEGRQWDVNSPGLFVMIGAVPRTDWLQDTVGLDAEGFIVTGSEARRHPSFAAHWRGQREPHFLETTRPGIFAVGDIRAGSVKRVASAVGEGAMAVKYAHELLAEQG